jgi:hypothetical protein
MSQSSIGITPRRWPSRMRRKLASEYLFEVHGISLSPATLAKLAVMGGGPQFWKDGAFPIYGPEYLDEFAVARLGKLRRSTSDQDQVAEAPRPGSGQ